MLDSLASRQYMERNVPTELWLRLPEGDPSVALTFDDCTSSNEWTALLDVLRDLRVSATFFATGLSVLSFPHLAMRTVREGHLIGNHGWDHRKHTELTEKEICSQLLENDRVWRSITGTSPRPFFRPPYRKFDARTRRAAATAGFPLMVLWDVDPFDWKNDSEAIAEHVVHTSKHGSIVVLHTIHQTVEALPRMVKGLRSIGMAPSHLTNV